MRLILFLFIICITAFSYSQTTKTIDHGGLTREYIEYVPSIYDGSTAVPVIFCLHGLGDNMTNFSGVGFHNVADTANCIIITPQAIEAYVYGSPVGTAWNSGASAYGIVLNDNVDDIGLFTAILDTTMALYNIDATRIYATGFSMGGFMCHRVASDLNSTIAAIASVSGTMGSAMVCNPSSPIPVLHFHGTIDGTVAYTANSYGNDAEVVVEYWRNFNNCDTVPVIDSIPDSASDGKTVVHYSYENGDDNTDVEFFKIVGGDHDWLFTPSSDIHYTKEIWWFLREYPKNNSDISNLDDSKSLIYPNPANDYLTIEFNNDIGNNNVSIYNSVGVKVYGITAKSNTIKLSTSKFKPGIYFLKANSKTKKIVVTH